jgi:hypothetical protein
MQMKEAGTAGLGTITREATVTADSGTSTASTGGAPVSMHPSVVVGSFQIGAYITTAVLAGLGMILL